MKGSLFGLIFMLTGAVCSAAAGDSLLSGLTSPVIFRGSETVAYRDPAVIYHDGVFHLYCTLSRFDPKDRGLINWLAHSQSTDLKHWTPPAPAAFTPSDRALNYSSPGNVIRYKNQWILCLQTYPTPGSGRTSGSRDSRIWIMRNDGLARPTRWSKPELLRVMGPEKADADMGRMIDPYLVEDRDAPGKWWCFFKHKLKNGKTVVDRSFSTDLKTWANAGRCKTASGENVCILRNGKGYVMFTSPGNGMNIYRSDSLASDRWVLQRTLTLGQKEWDWASGRLTAGFVLDLRNVPRVGKYVMFFHGSQKGAHPETHGAASIGIAWSDDLEHWNWPKAEASKPSL